MDPKRNKWRILLAAAAAAGIFRSEPVMADSGYLVKSREENRKLMMELVSAAETGKRQEFSITGVDYVPETLIIAQMFPQAVNISNTRIREYRQDGHVYTCCRIGFEKSRYSRGCSHHWEEKTVEEPGCLTMGKASLVCTRCGTETAALLPAAGHREENGDSLCDTCGIRCTGQKKGDRIQIWYEGEEDRIPMTFICADEEYGEGMLYLGSGEYLSRSAAEGGEEELRRWLDMDFANQISIHGACREVFLAGPDGKPLEQGTWTRETEARPALVLDRPSAEQEPEKRFWRQGDAMIRKIGEQPYLFRCIDDNYQSGSSGSRPSALFLCAAVIRSDLDSTESRKTILTFGSSNNYRNSEIRSWLMEHAENGAGDMQPVHTGIRMAFSGKTPDRQFRDLELSELVRHPLPYQDLTDRMFLLSVEEAERYREFLWKSGVTGEKGPESQSQPFCRGYWLRSPAFESDGNGKFLYGKNVYVVDLEKGCIRPAPVSDGTMGIRPAFCLPQA